MKFNKILIVSSICLALSSANSVAQQVALLDSGVDPNAGFNLLPGFNYFDNSEDTSDNTIDMHGTISARLITESYSGPILPFVITDSTPEGASRSTVARDNALSDVLGRDNVRVVAITRGSVGVADTASALIPELSNANKVIAILSGNDSSNQPNALSSSSFNLSGAIIVGAADFDGNLLQETNRAGTTQNKYVTAIGLPTADFEGSGDTSWATARIAGIAALVLEQNTELTAAEVVEVILDSAEDRGATGVDSEYGRGFIANAAQVLDNIIGPPVVPTPDPTPAPVDTGGGGGGGAGAALLVGGVVAGAILLLRKRSSRLEKTLVLDSYGRTFQVDLSDQVQVVDDALNLEQFFFSLDQQQRVSSGFDLPQLSTSVEFAAISGGDFRFDYAEYFAVPDDVVLSDDNAKVSLAVRSQLTENIDLVGGFQTDPDQRFGASSLLASNPLFGKTSFISGHSFGSVLSGFSDQAESLSLNYRAGAKQNRRLGFGLVSVNDTRQFGLDSLSAILEGGYEFTENVGLNLQFGQIKENGSLFGGASGGLFGVENTTTYAINLAGKIRATDKVSLVANYGVAKSSVESSANSLLNGFSTLRSDWYSIGLIGNNLFRKQDQIGFSFTQPLKIRSGNVDYSVPINRGLDRVINFDIQTVNLSDTNATEHVVDAYYRTMLTDHFEFGSYLSYRINPNHVSDQGNDVLMMATLKYWH